MMALSIAKTRCCWYEVWGFDGGDLGSYCIWCVWVQ